MPPPRYRTTRVIAGDVRAGDDIYYRDDVWRNGIWRYVSAVWNDGDRVKLDLLSDVLDVDRNAPVLVRWQIPTTTIGMAQVVRR